jgi:hypothetical protein
MSLQNDFRIFPQLAKKIPQFNFYFVKGQTPSQFLFLLPNRSIYFCNSKEKYICTQAVTDSCQREQGRKVYPMLMSRD